MTGPEIGTIFITHIERIKIAEIEKLAVLQTRKLAKYYGQHITRCTEFVNDVQQAENIQEITDIIYKYFN